MRSSMIKISHLLFFFLYLLPLALCKTKQTALVKVQNKTPNPISGLSISHKYSDVYKSQFDWEGTIPAGNISSEAMAVEYNTGFGTTGRDWWQVTYHREQPDSVRPNEVKMWYTDPTNFRDIIDFLEKAAPSLIQKAIDVAKGSNPQLLPAAKAAKIVSKVMCKLLLNKESTARFKQHILREEDAGKTTVIVIHADNTVSFHSASGTSETVTSTKWMGAEHA